MSTLRLISDVRHAIDAFLAARASCADASALLEMRRRAVLTLMAGERTLRTPEFVVTQDHGMLLITCIPKPAQEER